ncbi:MAG TPA: xanthine dehydrogenase family protein subunit M [Firmicutes bacterium]|nr:xanthine dehydrogenase family protein subunit M [Bacillota bacterium]HAA34164.1 xanthine dehydrogenase family protein subunit M [Bacillota bacterium]
MYLPDFEYFTPDSVEEACQLLSKYGPKAMAIAGGTDIVVKMKKEVLAPEILVSIGHLPELKKIEYVPGKGVVIGAGVTHNEVQNSKILQEKYLSVCEAAHQMANNQVRNLGTIGGNISNAVPSADMPPILIALDTTVKIVGSKKERTLPLEDVFKGPNQTVLEHDELITEFVIPDGSFTGSTYLKFGLRASGALAVVGVAASVQMDGGVIKDARIVLGAVSPVPLRAKEAENLLKGKQASEELFEEAGVIASGECRPISDIRASAEYRRDMVRVFTRRALLKAVNEGHV